MKPAFLFPILILAACSTSQNGSQQTDSAAVDETKSNSTVINQTSCFLHLGGSRNQDTTYIQLTIDGNRASGTYNHMLYEKDSRKGTFTGTVKDNMVDGMWRYMQEGMQDSLPLKLRLSGDMLYQQNYTFSPADGRQVLTDTAKFSIGFHKTECR